VIETNGFSWLTSSTDPQVTSAAMGYSTWNLSGAFQSASERPKTRNFPGRVSMCDDPAAEWRRGGGAWEIWNFGAEENTYDTLWIAANLPLMFTAAQSISQFTGFRTPTSYQPLPTRIPWV